MGYTSLFDMNSGNHSHEISDVNNLSTELNNIKNADVKTHTHEISDVNNLENTLSGMSSPIVKLGETVLSADNTSIKVSGLGTNLLNTYSRIKVVFSGSCENSNSAATYFVINDDTNTSYNTGSSSNTSGFNIGTLAGNTTGFVMYLFKVNTGGSGTFVGMNFYGADNASGIYWKDNVSNSLAIRNRTTHKLSRLTVYGCK